MLAFSTYREALDGYMYRFQLNDYCPIEKRTTRLSVRCASVLGSVRIELKSVQTPIFAADTGHALVIEMGIGQNWLSPVIICFLCLNAIK